MHNLTDCATKDKDVGGRFARSDLQLLYTCRPAGACYMWINANYTPVASPRLS